MKIDVHTHILPPQWPDMIERSGYPGWLRLEHCGNCRARLMKGDTFFREIGDNCWDAVKRVSECDGFGVDVQVLSTLPVMFSYWAKPTDALELSRVLNDHIAEQVRANPKRFVGLATIPMQDPDVACRELERCVRELGLIGAQIGTHIDANKFADRAAVWNLDAIELRPVFATAERLSAALFVHPWDMLGQERMPKYWLPWLVAMPAETALAICSMIFGGVFERFPRLRVCFAHGGGAFAGTIGRIERGFQARPDLCAVDNSVGPREYLAKGDRSARFWVDSLTHDETMLRVLLGLFGARRICLGSDYPFPLGEERPGSLIESMKDLSADVRHALLRGAAEEFLAMGGRAE